MPSDVYILQESPYWNSQSLQGCDEGVGEAGGDGGDEMVKGIVDEAVKGILGEWSGMASGHDGGGQADRQVGGERSGGEELGGAEPV
jgi:hypothetical protein